MKEGVDRVGGRKPSLEKKECREGLGCKLAEKYKNMKGDRITHSTNKISLIRKNIMYRSWIDREKGEKKRRFCRKGSNV